MPENPPVLDIRLANPSDDTEMRVYQDLYEQAERAELPDASVYTLADTVAVLTLAPLGWFYQGYAAFEDGRMVGERLLVGSTVDNRQAAKMWGLGATAGTVSRGRRRPRGVPRRGVSQPEAPHPAEHGDVPVRGTCRPSLPPVRRTSWLRPRQHAGRAPAGSAGAGQSPGRPGDRGEHPQRTLRVAHSGGPDPTRTGTGLLRRPQPTGPRGARRHAADRTGTSHATDPRRPGRRDPRAGPHPGHRAGLGHRGNRCRADLRSRDGARETRRSTSGPQSWLRSIAATASGSPSRSRTPGPSSSGSRTSDSSPRRTPRPTPTWRPSTRRSDSHRAHSRESSSGYCPSVELQGDTLDEFGSSQQLE